MTPFDNKTVKSDLGLSCQKSKFDEPPNKPKQISKSCTCSRHSTRSSFKSAILKETALAQIKEEALQNKFLLNNENERRASELAQARLQLEI